MKITIISCGGTICGIEDNSIIRQKSDINRLMSKLDNSFDKLKFIDISSVASENNDGIRISKIVNTVLKELKETEGIIILHGTDTIQYTAAALSYACGSNTIPIILVSSNYILDDERTNGYINFKYALLFIKEHCGFGVFAVYKNIEDEFPTVHRGSRLLLHCDYSDSLYSLCDQYYGKFMENKFFKNVSYISHEDEMKPFDEIHLPHSSSNISVLNAYPGMNFNISLNNVSALLIKCYHSGTLPSSDSNFKNLLTDIKKNNIPCFLSGGSESTYESCEEFDAFGLIRLPVISFPSQYIKLWLGVETNQDLKKFMLFSLGEDII